MAAGLPAGLSGASGVNVGPKGPSPAPAMPSAPAPAAPAAAPSGDAAPSAPLKRGPGPNAKPADTTHASGKPIRSDEQFESGMLDDMSKEKTLQEQDFEALDNEEPQTEPTGEGVPPTDGAPAQEAEPPPPSTIKVGDAEYTLEELQKFKKSQDDWDVMNSLLARNPAFRQAINGVFAALREGTLGQQRPPVAPAAQQAPPPAPPPDFSEVIAEFPEDVRGPMKKALTSLQSQMEAKYKAELSSYKERLDKTESITQDNLMDKEWNDANAYIKHHGLVPMDEMRVAQAAHAKGMPILETYMSLYFHENMLKQKNGKAATAAGGATAAAPAKAGAVDGATPKAAAPAARPIGRPMNPARPASPPPPNIGKMSGPQADDYLLRAIRKAVRSGT
jgi:hypothetical protein